MSLDSQKTVYIRPIKTGQKPARFPQLHSSDDHVSRYSEFRSFWTQCEIEVNEILAANASPVLNRIIEKVEQEAPWNDDEDFQYRIPGLLLVCGTNIINHNLLLRGLGQTLGVKKDIRLVILDNCHDIKSAVRAILLSLYGLKVGSELDIEEIVKYCQAHRLRRLVLLIKNLNTFNSSVLHKLLNIISKTPEVPFRILFNTSSFSGFPMAISRLVRCEKLVISNDTAKILNELCEKLVFENLRFLFGPHFLQSLFHNSLTVDNFVASIKYAIMQHYFRNDVSALQRHQEIVTNFGQSRKNLNRFLNTLVLVQNRVNVKTSKLDLYCMIVGDLNKYNQYINELLISLSKINHRAFEILLGDLRQELLAGNLLVKRLFDESRIESYTPIDSKNTIQFNVEYERKLHGFIDAFNHVFFTPRDIEPGTVVVTEFFQLLNFPYKELLVIDTDILMTTRSPNVRKTLELRLSQGDGFIVELFKLYKEAPLNINLYDYYLSFKFTLDKEKYFQELGEVDDWDKLVLTWFLSSLYDLQFIGVLRSGKRRIESLQKVIWTLK